MKTRSVLMLASILALALVLPCFAYPYSYMYRNPVPTVTVSSSIYPEVLMPGDSGVVSIEIENSADEYVVSYQREDFSFTVPVYWAELSGTENLEVTTDPYENIGSIGPDDKIMVYYNVKADENITDGTYFLDVKIVGGYEEAPEKINRKIQVKVDSSDVMLIQAEVPTSSSVSLDVANPRQNTLNAVTVIPKAKGIEFSPEEYYIGTMEPDEIFTIDFDLTSLVPVDVADLDFKSRFKNGDTWHESEVYTITSRGSMDMAGNAKGAPGNRNSGVETTTVAAAILILAMIGGAYFWRRRTKRP